MKKYITFILFVTSVGVFAQQQQGDLAIQFSGSYRNIRVEVDDETTRYSNGNITVKMGKFFTQNLELGVKPYVNFFPKFESEIKDGELQTKTKLGTSIGFGLYGTYSFLTADAKFMPYAGAEISYDPAGDESSVNLGPYAGVKYFITEDINIDANLNWLFALGTSYEESAKIGVLNFNVGIGVIIGKLN